MTRNIHEPSFPRALRSTQFGTKGQKQKPLAGRWVTPDCESTAISVAEGECRGDEPDLVNGFAQAEPPLEPFSFRRHMDGSLEFKGHLDVEFATSPSVAVTLPGANDGEPDYLPNFNQFFHLVVVEDADRIMALAKLDSTTGELTLTWPSS